MDMVWHLLFYLISLRASCQGLAISIPGDGKTLEYYLCDHGLNKSNTTLILASNATHSINGRNTLCIVDNISNITIESDTPGSLATVNCISNHTTGFAFLNASQVTLIDVLFNGCGGIIGNGNLLESLNQVPSQRKDPYYKFQGLNRVTLLFQNSRDIIMHNIHVTTYTGFGIILANSFGCINMTHLNITNALTKNNHSDTVTAGSGLLMIFNTERMSGNASVQMSSVIITEGYTTEFNDSLIGEIDDNAKDYPLIRVAAGLSVIISEPYNPSHIVNIAMDNLTIRNNRGGGIVLVYINTVYSNITIDTAYISSCLPARLNSQNRIGESLTVYYALTELRLQQGGLFDYSLSLLNVNFTALISDSCRSKYGNLSSEGVKKKAFNLTSVLVRVIGNFVGERVTDNHSQRIMLRNVYFTKDFPGVTDEDLGIGLYVYSFNSIAMTLENVTATQFSCSDSGYRSNNPYYSCERMGSLAFKHMKDLQVVGGLFTHHRDCSAFFIHSSPLKLSGNITVSDNTGVFYGALQLLRSSQLLLMEPLFLNLNHNRALYGGALYIYDEFNTECGIQVVPKVNYTMYSDMNITLQISNNDAVLSGNTIYGYRLHHCDRIDQLSDNASLFNILLKLMDPKQNRSETREIASPASLVCICNDSSTIPALPCMDHIQSRNYSNIHPGHAINVHLVTTDSSVSVYGTVTARFVDIPQNLYVHLAQQQVSASVAAGQCTGVNFTIYHNATSETNVTLEIAATSEISQAFLHLTLVGCSNGLVKKNDKYGGKCDCIDVYKDFGCVNGSIIRKYADSWIGYTSDKKYGFTYACPSGFCNDSLTTTKIVTDLNVSSPMCNGGRTGTMCSLCPRGKSVVFGSVDCKSCSNWYIVTILFYAVCGVLLVTMLFLLQLTVRIGTINGLIFYANLLSTGFTLGYLLQVDPNLYLLRVFVSFINLNLGFPLCFYNGMDEEVNRLLQFVFPVYVWIIIGLIIVISKRSPKLSSLIGRHCVPVLATLIQLSYSKIMTNVTETFSFTHVYVMDSPDSKVTTNAVWFFAGVKYDSPLHITHIFISLTFLLIFVVPYTFIITFAPFLGKYRLTSKYLVSKYMPFFDAIYAPYKEKWRCWFGARLCLLLVLLIFRASLSGYSFRWNVGVQFLSVLVFTLLQVHYKPFKNMFIHCLDVFFMLNFCFCAYFAIALPNDTPLFITVTTFVITAFIVFIGIIIYHIYFVFLKESIPCVWLGKKIGTSKASNVLIRTQSDISLKSSMESYCTHGTFGRLREPILDYIDSDEGTSTNSY